MAYLPSALSTDRAAQTQASLLPVNKYWSLKGQDGGEIDACLEESECLQLHRLLDVIFFLKDICGSPVKKSAFLPML